MSDDEGSAVIIETDRLLVRLQRRSDIEFLVDLWSDAEITRGLGGPRDRESLRAGFAATAAEPAAERFDLWPVVERETDRLAGHCGLLDKQVEGREEIELVYVMATPFQRRGYATEAGRALVDYGLRGLGARRIIALIEPGNEVSVRTARAVGMRFQREVRRPGGVVRRLYATAADSRAATTGDGGATAATADAQPADAQGGSDG